MPAKMVLPSPYSQIVSDDNMFFLGTAISMKSGQLNLGSFECFKLRASSKYQSRTHVSKGSGDRNIEIYFTLKGTSTRIDDGVYDGDDDDVDEYKWCCIG